MYKAFFESPIGILKIVSFKDKINSVEFVEIKEESIMNNLLEDCITLLEEYFEGKRKKINIPLEIRGTDFQIKVLNIIKTIPYGETISYKNIAILLGGIKYSRAVGNVCNKNRLPILIPCHRVIGSNNKLTGYSAGISKKQWLLDFEKKNLKTNIHAY